jgi:hypothetical protein
MGFDTEEMGGVKMVLVFGLHGGRRGNLGETGAGDWEGEGKIIRNLKLKACFFVFIFYFLFKGWLTQVGLTSLFADRRCKKCF